MELFEMYEVDESTNGGMRDVGDDGGGRFAPVRGSAGLAVADAGAPSPDLERRVVDGRTGVVEGRAGEVDEEGYQVVTRARSKKTGNGTTCETRNNPFGFRFD